MSKRVLIVSPHFPPINAPDHQRVRMALPYLRDQKWEGVVLAVNADASENGRDYSLLHTIPDGVEIHRVDAISAKLTRRVGVGNLALRCLPYLRQKGEELLSQREFDLVFFSTSIFPVMALGPVWRKKYEVPYVLDFQDPWRPEDYEGRPSARPGGRVKYALSDTLARVLEPRAIRHAAHIIVVSPAYPEQLRRRYPAINSIPITILPFAAAENDFVSARTADLHHTIFRPGDGLVHWVYAGVAGPMMHLPIRSFFAALQKRLITEPALRQRLRVHFVGTEYGGSGQQQVTAIATEFGLHGIVDEQTSRLPFLTTLKLLDDADALLIFGSTDPAYSASKVFPYILASKPLLVIAHKQSPVSEIVRRTRAGIVVDFTASDEFEQISNRIYQSWFVEHLGNAKTDWEAFEQYTSASMTRTLCQVFDNACETKRH